MSTTSPTRRRAVFLDVDGTILQDGTFIPPSAIDAIHAARANGHLMFLSTGRGMAELYGEVLEIGFDGAVSNGGGFATVGDEIVVARLMPAETVARLEEYFTARGIHWYLQSFDGLFASPELRGLMQGYLEHDRARHVERARAAGVHPDEIEFFSLAMKVFDEPERLDRAAIAKAVFLGNDVETIEAALADLGGEFAVVGGTIPVPFGASGEVTLAGVNKGATILDLLAHLGIDPADAIAVGDNWNDVEMFEVCGLSIAMGNAVPGVQALADQVTTPIDDDGIRNAFLRNGLL